MKIIPTKYFQNDVRFYVRKKKFLKIDADIKTVTDELEQGNLVGDKMDGLNLPANTAAYKVRVANSSTNVGKSHGFRIIYYVVIDEKIYLVTIYSKKDDIRIVSDKQIEQLIKILLEPETPEEA